MKDIFAVSSRFGRMSENAPDKMPNTQRLPTKLDEYLKYYCALSEPGYAVFVVGSWGTGKTHQVQRFLSRTDSYYVSLFGLTSAEQIASAVLVSMFPIAGKVKRGIGSINEISVEMNGIGGALGGLTSSVADALIRLKVKTDKPIILDDLERCEVTAKVAMGVINNYVEHHKCRVIVIADESKLSNDYEEVKEKLFGKRIQAMPETDELFVKIIERIPSSPAKVLIEQRRELIIDVFKQSKVPSLRVFRHAVEDLHRLLSVLTDEHRANEKAMTELTKLFLALDIEFRAGNLKREDLSKRSSTYYGHMVGLAAKTADKSEPRFVTSSKKYPLISLTSSLLNDECLEEMLVHGTFDENSVRNSLDQSEYFTKSELPAWKIVANFQQMNDSEVVPAFEKMEEQFSSRAITDPGEVLHVFALRMWLSQLGIIDMPLEKIAGECHQYIDDLLSKDALPPYELKRDPFGDRAGSLGYAYTVLPEYEHQFKELSDHLHDARELALARTFPQHSEKILKLLKTSGQKFFDNISPTATQSGDYVKLPVLAIIPPEQFVNHWMESPKDNWYAIKMALQERYKMLGGNSDLESELPWIKSVVQLLNERADQEKGFTRVRIRKTIPHVLGVTG